MKSTSGSSGTEGPFSVLFLWCKLWPYAKRGCRTQGYRMLQFFSAGMKWPERKRQQVLNECPDDWHIVSFIVPDIVSDITIQCTISYSDIVPDILNKYFLFIMLHFSSVGTCSLAQWLSLRFPTESFNIRDLYGVIMDVPQSVCRIFWHWKEDIWPFALLRKTLFSNFAVMKKGYIVPDIGVDIVSDKTTDMAPDIAYDM